MIRTITITAVTIGFAMGSTYAAGIRWNTSPSMPVGLWQVQALAGPIQRGDIVTLCLPTDAAALGRERDYLTGGECLGNVELLIKTVAAIPGDQVDVTEQGVSVNGSLIADSMPLPRDDQGRTVQAFSGGLYYVGEQQVWVISIADPRSFDSRYYGPVPLANLRGQARPLFVSQ